MSKHDDFRTFKQQVIVEGEQEAEKHNELFTAGVLLGIYQRTTLDIERRALAHVVHDLLQGENEAVEDN